MNSPSVKVALITVWLGSSGALAQVPETNCAELRRIVAAAQEEEPYASLRWEPHAPALGFDNCSVLDMSLEGDSPDFGCITDFPDSLRRWEQLNADILRCLPGARRVQPRSRSPRQPGRWADFRIGRVLILTHEAGYGNQPERYVAIHIERAEETD